MMTNYKAWWIWLLVTVISSTRNQLVVVLASQCKQTNSVFGHRLRSHVIRRTFESGVFECMSRCREQCFCRSINYRMTDKLCELNYANKTDRVKDYGPEDQFIYMELEKPNTYYKSCMDLKAINPSAPSGNYNLVLKDRCLVAYCDMENYGGGWTLAVSISNQNNDHLQTAQHNCLNSFLCVPHQNPIKQTRKLSDQEIHQLAASEGTFRVQVIKVSETYDVFYQIPSGHKNFNSSCSGMNRTCPRIIVSHSPFPYAWESNCRGTSIGYHISPTECHRVFDGHSDGECQNSLWTSSLYTTKRALYGYPCPSNLHNSKGIYHNNGGMLFVQ